MENINNNTPNQQPSRKGNLNPMYGKRHDEETKRKISDSQKKRYQAIRQAISEANILQQGRTDNEARKDVLRQCLLNNNISFNSVQQAIDFISIILGKDNIAKVIDEEIQNFCKNECLPS